MFTRIISYAFSYHANIMLMSGFDEDLPSLVDNEILSEQPTKIVRKNSFIDLLSDPINIPDNTLIDMQIDLLTNEWDLPKLNPQAKGAENLELDFEDLFNLKFSIKKPETDIKIPIYKHIDKKPKCVGTLTTEQRKQKILKYLEKRKKRRIYP